MHRYDIQSKQHKTAAGERRERRDAQRNLERVLHAAHELFAERGPDVRMEEIAQRAGVGVGTIYRRFRSKDELFAAVRQVVCDDTRDSLQQAAHNGCDPASKLRSLVLVQYRRSASQTALLELHNANAAGACGVFDQEELYDALHAMLERVIAEGQREGLLRPGNTAVLAALCLELISPRTFQHVARVAGANPEDLAAYTADFVLHALRAH
jgi:AcrR family transcriptional regulator